MNSYPVTAWIDLQHDGRILSRQYHFRAASPLKVGDRVKKGDRIGILGATGHTTGIHLHFGIKENSTKWNNGMDVDPEPYLRGEKSIGNTPPQSGTAFKVGDKVRILQTATVYATGQTIPDWAKSRVHTVGQTGSDRILLSEIFSWVWVRDLTRA